jgi:hypothetical protein
MEPHKKMEPLSIKWNALSINGTRRPKMFYNNNKISKVEAQFYFFTRSIIFSEFPMGNTAITVGLMVRLKPGTMLLFRFKVPRDQKQ